MTLYLDASALLESVLSPAPEPPLWHRFGRPITSALARVECLRTIDRIRHTGERDRLATSRRIQAVHDVLSSIELIAITPAILQRAAEPFPVVVKTLDAIHLATALLWREDHGDAFLFATHDQQLARAARSVDFDVIGV